MNGKKSKSIRRMADEALSMSSDERTKLMRERSWSKQLTSENKRASLWRNRYRMLKSWYRQGRLKITQVAR